MKQGHRVPIDYVNAIVAFFAHIQLKRGKEKLVQTDDSRLSWKEISEYRKNHPLPTLQAFFGESYLNTLHYLNESESCELDYVVNRLNETEDVFIWKRATNRLLQILQGTNYKPFYPGAEYDQALPIDEID